MADLKLLFNLFRSLPLNRSCEHTFNEQDVIREIIGRRDEIIGITVKDLQEALNGGCSGKNKDRFCSPIELSIPAGVSASRGCGLPSLGSMVVPLQTMAPSLWISTKSEYSVP